LALGSSIISLILSGILASEAAVAPVSFSAPWIPQLGASFSLYGDGLSAMLTLLTGIVMPAVVLANWNKEVERPWAFYGLMLLTQAGITGVFLAYDALLFYFFWELALVPVYFLCSR